MADHITRSATAARVLAAACVVAAGVVHLQQYYGVYYRVIPTIGPLFVLDFALAVALGLALLLPLDRVWRPLATLAAVGGILFSVGAIIGLQISESGTLFGFHEHGYRLAVVLSLVFEGAAIVLLAGYLAARWRAARGGGPASADRSMHDAMTRPGAPAPSDRRTMPRW